MSLFKRRLFLFFFVLLFFFTAPIVVLFATGYRFDSANKIFVHSGSVTIESLPADVDIFLNGKKQKEKTVNSINNSFTINGLRPGKYTLRCEKEGYTTWEKNIEVHSGVSTEFWNVLLYSNDSAETVQYNTPSIQQFFLSPRENNELVFFSKENDLNKVSLLDIESNQYEDIYATADLKFIDPKEEENVEWSSDNEQILIPLTDVAKKTYIIARIKKDQLNNVTNLNDVFDKKDVMIEKVRWMFDKNDELVILTSDHKLYYFYLDAPERTVLLDENVSAFNFAGNRIYYTQLPNNLVWEIKGDDSSTKRQITNISVASEKEEFIDLIVYDEYRMALINNKKRLFVYNEEKEKGEKFMNEISADVESIQFSNDGKKLLYWTNNEIWTLILRDWDVQPIRKKNDRIMTTRFSQPIKNVQWMENYENILFTAGNQLKSAELDSRDRINIVDVAASSYDLDSRDLFYNKNNQVVFFKNKVGESYLLKSKLLLDRGGFLGF